MSLDAALAREVITDHARRRRGRVEHPAPELDVQNRQYNPVCGDEVWVRAALGEREGLTVLTGFAWTGEGCSISQASASVLHDVALGSTVVQVRDAVEHFRVMIRSRGQLPGDERVIGDGVAFAGVGRHLSRVKCAMLGWVALDQALQDVEAVTGQERYR